MVSQRHAAATKGANEGLSTPLMQMACTMLEQIATHAFLQAPNACDRPLLATRNYPVTRKSNLSECTSTVLTAETGCTLVEVSFRRYSTAFRWQQSVLRLELTLQLSAELKLGP